MQKKSQTAPSIMATNASFAPVMSSFAIDLSLTSGFLVADRRGRLVGRVEGPMYGTAPDEPDALAVRSGIFSRRRIVPAAAIEEIDGASGVIALRVERAAIRTFL